MVRGRLVRGRLVPGTEPSPGVAGGVAGGVPGTVPAEPAPEPGLVPGTVSGSVSGSVPGTRKRSNVAAWNRFLGSSAASPLIGGSVGRVNDTITAWFPLRGQTVARPSFPLAGDEVHPGSPVTPRCPCYFERCAHKPCGVAGLTAAQAARLSAYRFPTASPTSDPGDIMMGLFAAVPTRLSRGFTEDARHPSSGTVRRYGALLPNDLVVGIISG